MSCSAQNARSMSSAPKALVADAEQRLNEMAQQYGEALQLNGKQSISLYATNKKLEALENEIARLRAERS